MAKAIDFTPRPKSPEEQLRASVQDSAPAIDDTLLLLRELHQHGVLDLLLKLVRGGEGLTATTLKLLSSDSGSAMLRNVLEVGKTLERLDSNELRVLGHALNTGLNEGARNAAAGKTLGVGELLALTRDRDVQVALGALTGILRGFGRALREARDETEEVPNQRELARGAR